MAGDISAKFTGSSSTITGMLPPRLLAISLVSHAHHCELRSHKSTARPSEQTRLAKEDIRKNRFNVYISSSLSLVYGIPSCEGVRRRTYLMALCPTLPRRSLPCRNIASVLLAWWFYLWRRGAGRQRCLRLLCVIALFALAR